MSRKPTGYYRQYEFKRRHDSSKEKGHRKELFQTIRNLATIRPEIDPDKICTAIRVMPVKTKHNMSYRTLATHLKSDPNERRRCGLAYAPSKSTLWGMGYLLAGAGKAFMDGIVRHMARRHMGKEMYGDSTGFGLRKYKEWISAKYGTMAKHDFVKLHVLCSAKDMIVAFDVTDADSHDSPVFGRMLKDLPKGCWKPVILDAAYDSYRNCEMIVKADRVPVIKPKKGSISRGFNPRARMIRWYDESRDDFMRTYHKRSRVEAVFSSIKERTGHTVRAKLTSTRTAELFCRVLCYNLSALTQSIRSTTVSV